MSLLIDLDKNDGIVMLKNSQTDSFNPWQPNHEYHQSIATFPSSLNAF